MRPRLCIYWLLSLAALGSFFPFMPLYLRENLRMSGAQVGAVMAMLPLVGLFVQPLWGQLADRTGARVGILALLCMGAAAGYLGLRQAEGFEGMLIAIGVLAIFSTGLQPAAMGVSMAMLGTDAPRDFGRHRAWGVAGFFVMIVSVPAALHFWQDATGHGATDAISEPGLEIVFYIAAAMSALAGLAALSLPAVGAMAVRASASDYRLLLRHGPYLRLLAFMLLGYLFLHGPMILFPIYVRDRGGSMDDLSTLWMCMLLLEIPLMLKSGVLLERMTPRWVLGAAVGAGGLRWLVCAFDERLLLAYPVQVLHGVVVTGFLVAAPLCVDALVPARLRSTGQAGLVMVGASLGAIVSSVLAGVVHDSLGIDAVYWIGGGCALLLAVTTPWLLPPIAIAKSGDDSSREGFDDLGEGRAVS